MTAPFLDGLPPELIAYLQDLEDRVGLIEAPQQPGRLYACVKANLPDPAPFIGCAAFATDLNILVHSDGVNWKREDTGATA